MTITATSYAAARTAAAKELRLPEDEIVWSDRRGDRLVERVGDHWTGYLAAEGGEDGRMIARIVILAAGSYELKFRPDAAERAAARGAELAE